MRSTKVFIVILNYKRWQDTRDCLESVLGSTYSNYTIMVIDNGSDNNSLQELSQWVSEAQTISPEQRNFGIYNTEELSNNFDWTEAPSLVFIQSKKNLGFGGGCNIGLQLLSKQDGYIWLLNPDMTVKSNTIQELVDFIDKQSVNCIVGAHVRSYTNANKLLFYGGGKINFLSGTVRFVTNADSVNQLDYISGGCLFTHANNFSTLGLLPEEYFLYWEETDWCYRAKQLDVELLVCPSAICYDKISTMIGKGFLANYYYCRNGLLFISKFRKHNLPLVLLLVPIRFLKRAITGQWGRAKGVMKGTIDFLKGRSNEVQ